MLAKPDIAVDFDGVIAVHDAWQGVHHFGDPIPFAKEFLTKLQEKYRIVIFTCRCNPLLNEKLATSELSALVENWLKAHDMPFDEVYTGLGKPIAQAYIDDKAICCMPQRFGKSEFKGALNHLGFDTSNDW